VPKKLLLLVGLICGSVHLSLGVDSGLTHQWRISKIKPNIRWT